MFGYLITKFVFFICKIYKYLCWKCEQIVCFVVWMDWHQFNTNDKHLYYIYITWIFINLNQKEESSVPLQYIILKFSSYSPALWFRGNISGFFIIANFEYLFFILFQKRVGRGRLLNDLRQLNLLNLRCEIDWKIWWHV